MFASYLLAISLTAVSGMALTMNYPSTLVQCQAAQFNWSNGQSPYNLMAAYNNTMNLRVLRLLAAAGEKTSYNWTVDFVTGTSLYLYVVDSISNTHSTPIFTVQPGTTNDCLTPSAALTLHYPTSLVSCETAQLSWTGGVPPYRLSFYLGSSAAGSDPLFVIRNITTQSYSWTVNISAGETVNIGLLDSLDGYSYSAASSSVGVGYSSACLATPGPVPHKISGGEIAGIVIGTVAGIAIVTLLAFLLYRRRKRGRNIDYRWDLADDNGEEYNPDRPTPFQPDMSQGNRNSLVPTLSPGLTTTASFPGSESPPLQMADHHTGSIALPSEGQSSSRWSHNDADVLGPGRGHESPRLSAKPAPRDTLLSTPEVTVMAQEHDAGPLASDGSRTSPIGSQTVPPQYDPGWIDLRRSYGQ
jgi:hypothetical protein